MRCSGEGRLVNLDVGKCFKLVAKFLRTFKKFPVSPTSLIIFPRPTRCKSSYLIIVKLIYEYILARRPFLPGAYIFIHSYMYAGRAVEVFYRIRNNFAKIFLLNV